MVRKAVVTPVMSDDDNIYPFKPDQTGSAMSWEQTARILLAVLREGDARARHLAEAEIVRMGRLLDQRAPDQETEHD